MRLGTLVVERTRFLQLVEKLKEKYIPPCWCVEGTLVYDYASKKNYHVIRWKYSKRSRSGIRVFVQKLHPPFFSVGRELDLWHLIPVTP